MDNLNSNAITNHQIKMNFLQNFLKQGYINFQITEGADSQFTKKENQQYAGTIQGLFFLEFNFHYSPLPQALSLNGTETRLLFILVVFGTFTVDRLDAIY